LSAKQSYRKDQLLGSCQKLVGNAETTYHLAKNPAAVEKLFSGNFVSKIRL